MSYFFADKQLFMTLSCMLLFCGCASYKPDPLNMDIKFPASTNDIVSPNINKRIFDAKDGLDEIEVATLAIINNPDLKVARASAKISNSNALAIGLLPIPQIGLSEQTAINPPQNSSIGYNLSLGYDINSIIFYFLNKKIADKEIKKNSLELLWKEWQTAVAALRLHSKLISLKRQKELLNAQLQLYNLQIRAYERLKNRFDAESKNSYLTLYDSAQKRLFEINTQEGALFYELNNLLGLDPSAKIELQESKKVEYPSDEEVIKKRDKLPYFRPDLLALREGYEAKEERVRKAVLSQFGAISVNLSKARDNANLYTNGYGITISLPPIDGNMANIKAEEASRESLKEEFNARVLSAKSEIDKLLTQRALFQQRELESEKLLTKLDKLTASAKKELDAKNIELPTYIRIASTSLDKKSEIYFLKDSLMDINIALFALCGVDLNKRGFDENR